MSAGGRHHPIVLGRCDSRDDVAQTLGVAGQCPAWARRWADGDRADPDFIETLGISQQQQDAVRVMIADGEWLGSIDPVVSFLIAATNGIRHRAIE